MVLLHSLAMLRTEARWSLRAVHVNHQLQASAVSWAQQCTDWCSQLSVPCKILTVHVNDIKQQGPEAAARKARYAALQAELQPDEVLLTAHHADDQLETILIALMRGAGLDGLAAMPALTRFATGWHARPLLEFTRDELQAWAAQQGLRYVTDPSNDQTRFDRNFLRHEVIPLLKQRWPAAAEAGARSVRHLGEAQSLLDEYVARDLSTTSQDNTLDVELLRGWSAARRHAVIRGWLQNNGVLMPSTRVLHSLEHDMLNSGDDRVPCSRWGIHAVHRYRGRLYLEKTYQPEQLDDSLPWNWQQPLSLPFYLGALRMTAGGSLSSARTAALNAAALPSQLRVAFRSGGERMRLPQESFHRELKTLLHDNDVLPWWRGRIPLIFADEQLVAVGHWWVSADFVASDTQSARYLQWEHNDSVIFSVN